MTVVVRKVATVTDKGQTTVPKSVREALGLSSGDRISFSIDENRTVSVERHEDDAADPVITGFLDFLAKDMRDNPDKSILDIPPALRDRIAAMTAGMAVDLDETIEGDVDL